MKRFIKKPAILFFAVTFIFSSHALAQLEGNPENFCRNGFFPRESKTYKIAKIAGKPKERVYFYGDEREDCPQNKNCRLKSYLVPNDEVIVSRKFGNFACVWFQPKKGFETVGWIPNGNLKYQPEAAVVKITDWLGEWTFYDNSIEIAAGKNRGLLSVTGNAIWKGVGDNTHVGEIEEEVAPLGNALKIGEKDTGEFDCKVSMEIVGNYLIVSDNMNCGGANVSFSGVYRRKAKK